MPKLNRRPFLPALRAETGSALVAAVAFAMVLLIASFGYLQVLASASNSEIESLRDDKAFVAAESGLLMGAKWLSQQSDWGTITAANLYTLQFDSTMQVIVDLLFDTTGLPVIQSTAHTLTPPHLPYAKRLSWVMDSLPPGFYGTFLNGVTGNNHRAQGGFMNTTFDGPFHANEAMKIAVPNPGSNVGTRFLDRVTIHHGDDDHWYYGDGIHDNNNYDYGIQMGDDNQDSVKNSGDTKKIDSLFKSSYLPHQDSLILPRIVGQDISLPVSDPPTSPVSQVAKGAYLELLGDSAIYYYRQGGPRQQVYHNIDNKVIRASNGLLVSGVLNGKTTIVTDSTHSIYPVGDIRYQGFTPDGNDDNYPNYNPINNYGVPLSNTSALALVSGKDIFFADQWEHPHSPGTASNIAGIGGGPMYVTASLIAVELGGTHRFLQTKAGVDSSASVNLYNKALQDGGIRIIGSRTLDQWMQFSTGAQKAADFFRMFFDRRLAGGLRMPGLPGVRRVLPGGGTAPLLDPRQWHEENIPN